MTHEIVVDVDRPLGHTVRDGLLADLNLVDKPHQRQAVERFQLRISMSSFPSAKHSGNTARSLSMFSRSKSIERPSIVSDIFFSSQKVYVFVKAKYLSIC